MRTETILRIEELTTEYRISGRSIVASKLVNLELQQGEILGLIGESGSGKTTVGKAVLRLLPASATVSGKIWFKGRDLLALTSEEFRMIRWSELALVPQNALSALDPLMRIGGQVTEPMTQRGANKDEALARAGSLLEEVGLSQSHLRSYPHELSGGMRQRVCIAMALVLDPVMLIADEPTTALDVIVEAEILTLLAGLREKLGLAMIYITHDLGVAARMCDRLAVMYDGHILEVAVPEDILMRPAHPYTMGLIRSYPRWDGVRSVSIPGAPPGAYDSLPGCPFAPRCPFFAVECNDALPEPAEVSPGHFARCLFAADGETLRQRAIPAAVWQRGGGA